MKVTYDPECNAVYIYLRKGLVDDTAEDANGFMIDYDREGKVIGIEILNAVADIDDPASMTYETLGVAATHKIAEREAIGT